MSNTPTPVAEPTKPEPKIIVADKNVTVVASPANPAPLQGTSASFASPQFVTVVASPANPAPLQGTSASFASPQFVTVVASPANPAPLQGTSASFASPQFVLCAAGVAAAAVGFFLGKITWDQFTAFFPIVAGAYLGAHAIVDGVARHALGKVLVSHNENRGE